MKLRNQLLALFCLLAFAGLGVLYFQHWVIRKAFGIILFIGEGLAPGRLAPTRAYAGGAGGHLSPPSMTQLGFLTQSSKKFAPPDQTAPATALAPPGRAANPATPLNADAQPNPTYFR